MKTTIAGLLAALGLVLSVADIDGDPNTSTSAERYTRLFGALLAAAGTALLGKSAKDNKPSL